MGLLDWLFGKRRRRPSRPRGDGGGDVPMYTDSGGVGLGPTWLEDNRHHDPHHGGDDSGNDGSSDSGNDGGSGGGDGGGGGGDGGGGGGGGD